MSAPRILSFSGSLRKASWNTRIVHVAAEAAREAGAEVTEIELRDLPLPIFDEDLETASGAPDNALELRALFREHDALLLGCPEYNSSITAALKNAIDWVSRPQEGFPPLDCFDGKVCGLVAASPGALGGLRGLVHVRAILSNIKVTVLPNQVAVPKVHEVMNEAGEITDDRFRGMVRSVGEDVARVTAKMTA